MSKGKVIHRSQEFFARAPTQDKPAKSWFKFAAEVPLVAEEEAFLTILIGAARANGFVSLEETQEIVALAYRTRTLANLTLDRITEVRKRIDERIGRDGLSNVLGAACACLFPLIRFAAENRC